MQYQDTSERLAQYRQQISDLRGKIRELQQSAEPQAVMDYTLASRDGPVRLSQLFSDKTSLFVIHNMGASCPYCTLWADGFNGLLPHIENRAAFVVASPDDPQAQEKFKASRGWRFRMVSHRDSTFAADTWAIGATTAGCRACRCSRNRATKSSGSRTRRSGRVMISARSGTSSISCPKAPRTGGQNTNTSVAVQKFVAVLSESTKLVICKP